VIFEHVQLHQQRKMSRSKMYPKTNLIVATESFNLHDSVVCPLYNVEDETWDHVFQFNSKTAKFFRMKATTALKRRPSDL